MSNARRRTRQSVTPKESGEAKSATQMQRARLRRFGDGTGVKLCETCGCRLKSRETRICRDEAGQRARANDKIALGTRVGPPLGEILRYWTSTHKARSRTDTVRIRTITKYYPFHITGTWQLCDTLFITVSDTSHSSFSQTASDMLDMSSWRQ